MAMLRWARRARAVSLSSLLVAAAACADSAGPGGPVAIGVSAGMYHSCAVMAGGAAYCWGRNSYGALGDGTTTPSATPVRVAVAVPFASIVAGWDHTCALTPAGAAYCWGMNFSGQVGDGSQVHRQMPVPVRGGLSFTALTTGEAHTCGIDTAGTTWCWGADLSPWPDGRPPGSHLQPERLSGYDFVAISVGYEVACALTPAGASYCWGLYPPGVVLPDSFGASPTPLPVADPTRLVTTSAGFKHACGIGADMRAWCWGLNESGQLGDGTRTASDSLRPVTGDHRWRVVSAHAPFHSCGIDTTGQGWCWGSNGSGALGDGSRTTSAAPVAVAGAREFAQVSPGGAHSCGLTTDGAVYCWGAGAAGQLGTGAFAGALEPVRVALP